MLHVPVKTTLTGAYRKGSLILSHLSFLSPLLLNFIEYEEVYMSEILW